MVLRDKDANTGAGGWTTAYDGAREERRYYAQNWRADVSAVVTSAGKLVEWVKHSSYGQSIGLAAGDTDSDGDWDATDSSYITGISGYEIRKDPDLDKDADAADVTFANSIKGGYHSMGRGVLSAVGNRKGYGGYENDIYFFKLFHVREAVLDNLLGRWTQRRSGDSAHDSNDYEYVQISSRMTVFPAELAREFTGCTSGHCSRLPDNMIDSAIAQTTPAAPAPAPTFLTPYPTVPCGTAQRAAACNRWATQQCNLRAGCRGNPTCCAECISEAAECCSARGCNAPGSASRCISEGVIALGKCNSRIPGAYWTCVNGCFDMNWQADCGEACRSCGIGFGLLVSCATYCAQGVAPGPLQLLCMKACLATAGAYSVAACGLCIGCTIGLYGQCMYYCT